MNPEPNRFFHLSLVFLVALNLVPHFNDYTVPTLAVGGVCLVWRLLYEFQITKLPNFWVKLGLVITLTYLVFLNYGQILGLEAGSALLICAVSLKLIDKVRYRDAMVLLFLNFMLLLARFFESQSLAITFFAAFDLIITTALLVQLHNGARMDFDIKTLLKTGGKLVIQISPFMILLFFVFPRYSTSFIRTNRPGGAITGFSEELKPGGVESLARVSRPAFRAQFPQGLPPVPQLYWRGGVLEISEGLNWRKQPKRAKRLKLPQRALKPLLESEILIEPDFNDWIFALETPEWLEHQNSRLQANTLNYGSGVFRLKKTPGKKYLYKVYSSGQGSSVLSQEMRELNLKVPPLADPRVQELISQWSKGNPNAEVKAQRALSYYANNFRYTLEPGALGDNPLTEFLFEKKVGFCEHFAASLATLLRYMEVPSRVIVGFQGGTKNKAGDYYLVTTRDAHAWVEYWSDQKKRWVRIDPTTVVAPLRLEWGGELFHSLTEDQRNLYASGQGDFLVGGWFKNIQNRFDAVSTQWNLFLLRYDQAGQKDFFARIGIDRVNQGLLLSLSLVILLLFFLWVRRSSQGNHYRISKAHEAYLSLLEKMAKKNFYRESHEGPRDFLRRAQEHWPEQADSLKEFSLHYLSQEYGEQDSLKSLKKLVRQIKF